MLFALSLGKTARAAASRFELTWSSSGDRACISEEELKEAVSARLGRDPFVPAGQGDVVVEGREVRARADQLRARIAQRDRSGHVLGTRDLEATSCEELRRSAAFVVFLIVDPDAAFGGATIEPVHPDTKDEGNPPTEQRSADANGEQPSADHEEKRRAPPKRFASRPSEGAVSSRPPAASAPGVGVDLGLGLVVSNGLLPKPDVGAALAVGVVPAPSLPIRLEWRAKLRIPVEPVQGYDFRAVEQEWRACYFRRVSGSIFGTACGGATWIAILPDARGLAGGDQAPKTVFSPTFAAGPAFELDGMRLFADLGLALPWPRYAFTYRDEGRAMPLHEVSRIVWSLGIGASRSFR